MKKIRLLALAAWLAAASGCTDVGQPAVRPELVARPRLAVLQAGLAVTKTPGGQ